MQIATMGGDGFNRKNLGGRSTRITWLMLEKTLSRVVMQVKWLSRSRTHLDYVLRRVANIEIDDIAKRSTDHELPRPYGIMVRVVLGW